MGGKKSCNRKLVVPGCCAPPVLSGSMAHYCEDVSCSSKFNRADYFCFTTNAIPLVWLPSNGNRDLNHAPSPRTSWMVWHDECKWRLIFASLVIPKSEANVFRCYPICFMTTCTHGSWMEQCIPNCYTQYLLGTLHILDHLQKCNFSNPFKISISLVISNFFHTLKKTRGVLYIYIIF